MSLYGPGAPGKLAEFLIRAAHALDGGFNPALFMELRYDQMNLWYPHETFGVDQAVPEFFWTTWNYVTGVKTIPFTRPGAEPGSDMTYWNHYRNWVLEHAREHLKK